MTLEALSGFSASFILSTSNPIDVTIKPHRIPINPLEITMKSKRTRMNVIDISPFNNLESHEILLNRIHITIKSFAVLNKSIDNTMNSL